MAVGKEILTKIRSVQNTQKITRAMQMVSTSKMRKTQERMRAARPYADKVRAVMAHLASANTDLEHPLLARRSEVKRAGIIVVTSDKGLCGGLNANVLKRFYAKVNELLRKASKWKPAHWARKAWQHANASRSMWWQVRFIWATCPRWKN